MKIKIFRFSVIILSLVLYVGFTINANKNSNEIFWNENLKLTWGDFIGNPNNNMQYKALTTGGSTYNYKSVGDSCRIITKAIFYRNESWIKKGHETDFLLKHEQTHFDIIELYTRILRKKLSEQKKVRRNLLNGVIKKLYATVNAEKSKYQTLYDKETAHSIKKEKQLEWNKKIEDELKLHEAFKDSVLMIYVEQ